MTEDWYVAFLPKASWRVATPPVGLRGSRRGDAMYYVLRAQCMKSLVCVYYSDLPI